MGELLEYLMDFHEEAMSISKIENFAEDLNEDRIHADRHIKIVGNMGERATVVIEELKKSKAETALKYKEQVLDLQDRITNEKLKNEAYEAKISEDIMMRKQFEEREDDRSYRIAKLEEENVALRKQLKQNETKIIEADQLAQQLHQHKCEIESLRGELIDLKGQVNNLLLEREAIKKEATVEKKEAV